MWSMLMWTLANEDNCIIHTLSQAPKTVLQYIIISNNKYTFVWSKVFILLIFRSMYVIDHLPKAARAPVKFSCLQTTLASSIPHPSSQTVPHVPLYSISTLPLDLFSLVLPYWSTNLTGYTGNVSLPVRLRVTITLYPIGRPVRATITLYPIGRLVGNT